MNDASPVARRLILLSVLALAAAAAPAAAQQSPAAGTLHVPASPSTPPPPEAPVSPQAAPVAPVQQVAPVAPAAKPARHAGRAKPAPLIQAPANVHAQRPAGTPPPAVATPAVTAAPNPAPPARTPESTASVTVGSVTGNPLPRWAALRSDEVNLRVGPGTRFPIQWQYHRRDLPVHILRELDVWRLIEDQDGVTGWVHQATLVGHRGFAVKGATATLRFSPSDDAAPVAFLKPGVVGRLRACEAASAWCEVQVGDYRGWLRREQFYGSDPGEALGN